LTRRFLSAATSSRAGAAKWAKRYCITTQKPKQSRLRYRLHGAGPGDIPGPAQVFRQHSGKISHPGEYMPKKTALDSDVRKGAVEVETNVPAQDGEPNLRGQLGHRDQDDMLKDADSDYPEPGSNPEHSGQRK
jgi:hypothetical protein